MTINLQRLKDIAIASAKNSPNQDESLLRAIQALRWSDLRDAFATHVFNSSGGNIFLVSRALDHRHFSTTRSYLRQHRQIRERFDSFRKVMDTALAEIREGRLIDPTILFLSANYRDFSESDRERLLNYRTRMGMGCANPFAPDQHIAPNHIRGTRCVVQRCIICRHGIIFKNAFSGLAERHADLVWLRSRTPPNRWLTSTLSWEIESIELVRDIIFAEHLESFQAHSSKRLAEIAAGRQYVFDDPELPSGQF